MEHEIQKLPPQLSETSKTLNLDIDGFKLSLRDRQIALEMIMKSFTGETNKMIAERHGMKIDALYQIPKNNPDFKRFQAYLYEELFGELFGKAVLALHDIMDNTVSPSVRLKAIQLILQANGRLKTEHTVSVEPPKKAQTLDELERERKEIFDMEVELLND